MILHDYALECAQSSTTKYFLREYKLWDSDILIMQILCYSFDSDDLFLTLFQSFFRLKYGTIEEILQFTLKNMKKKEACSLLTELAYTFPRFLIMLMIDDASISNLLLNRKDFAKEVE